MWVSYYILTADLTSLDNKRLLTACSLARKFNTNIFSNGPFGSMLCYSQRDYSVNLISSVWWLLPLSLISLL